MKQKSIIVFLVIIILALLAGGYYILTLEEEVVIKEDKYLASKELEITLYNEELNEVAKKIRGTKVTYYPEIFIESFYKVDIEKNTYYVLSDNLVSNYEDVVLESDIYIRTETTLYDSDFLNIKSALKKGEQLEVIGFDELLEDGSVNMYEVSTEDTNGYIYRKYTERTKEKALLRNDEHFKFHEKRGNRYGGGDAANLDYFLVEKEKFENNIRPDVVKALYLNAGVVKNVDKYIAIAKESSINAFIVDIKDNQMPGYKSEVMKELSPTNYNKALNTYEDYKKSITKLKDEGYYVVGRITVFKDSYYINDHPEDAIMDTRDNKPYLKSSSYWPTAYSRNVWEFNVKLALEAVKEFGFNEIQFDYVRFPDKTGAAEKIMDYQNKYQEDKAVAIQQFLFYACDKIHEQEVYVSADVFGETVNSYVSAYGQYWPAISNVVDVISGMPYPDHFAKWSYGLEYPFLEPYKLMENWAKIGSKRQLEIPSPADVRTWIQAFNVSAYKYPPDGYRYGPKQIADQINGLNDGGFINGYMTWNSGGYLSIYNNQKEAYK